MHRSSAANESDSIVAPILRVPRKIRMRIWDLVGFPKGAFIYLDETQEINEHAKEQRMMLFRGSRLSIYDLLLTCRKIYAELSHVLYSRNKFVTHHLEPLHNLRPSSLSSLRSLKVFLHASGGSEEHSCGSRYPHELEALDSRTGEGQFTLARWQAASELLSRHMRPNRLDFSLLCDSANERTAGDVLECLSGFPVLADFHVRLASKPDPALRRLAEEASYKVTGRHSIEVFRFFSLPPELRLHILEHTDLVAPTRSISWRPAASTESFEGGRFEDRSIDTVQCRDIIRAGCFCAYQHAAYSTTCRYWRSPQSLFLVSKAFCEEARDVFYKRNCFCIKPAAGDQLWPDGRPVHQLLSPRLPVSRFFTHGIPACAYTTLRYLDLGNFMYFACPGELTQQRRDEWFRTVAYVERSGGTDLDYVYVAGSARGSLPLHEGWRNADALDIIRDFVSTKIWPLNETTGPRLRTRQLHVGLGYYGPLIEYNLRRRNEALRDDGLGPELASRVVTFSSQDSSEAVAGTGTPLVEWIETVWVGDT
ncbi:hypothetical protein F5Y18DRAFT_368173 [Xylariaceae sp. FL1019]|nr:hypothetical protein F5Y18DRAFT_368173 [Xylariaceae sp. FL1019]